MRDDRQSDNSAAYRDSIDGKLERAKDAALGSQSIRYMTLDELRSFQARYQALLEEDDLRQRTEDPSLRPSDARPVKILLLAFPVPATPAGN